MAIVQTAWGLVSNTVRQEIVGLVLERFLQKSFLEAVTALLLFLRHLLDGKGTTTQFALYPGRVQTGNTGGRGKFRPLFLVPAIPRFMVTAFRTLFRRSSRINRSSCEFLGTPVCLNNRASSRVRAKTGTAGSGEFPSPPLFLGPAVLYFMGTAFLTLSRRNNGIDRNHRRLGWIRTCNAGSGNEPVSPFLPGPAVLCLMDTACHALFRRNKRNISKRRVGWRRTGNTEGRGKSTPPLFLGPAIPRFMGTAFRTLFRTNGRNSTNCSRITGVLCFGLLGADCIISISISIACVVRSRSLSRILIRPRIRIGRRILHRTSNNVVDGLVPQIVQEVTLSVSLRTNSNTAVLVLARPSENEHE